MGRSPKKGLDFYKKDVDFYEDLKVFSLMTKYGPLGVTVYDIVLTMIYREGYYIEAPIQIIAMQVARYLGKWCDNVDKIVQIIHYCAELDLLSRDFLCNGVITSAAIQRRYAEITSRNKVDKTKYWLLDEQPSEGQPYDSISATEKPISATETAISATDIPLRIRNKNKSKNKNSAGASYDLELFTKSSLTKPPVYRKKGE